MELADPRWEKKSYQGVLVKASWNPGRSVLGFWVVSRTAYGAGWRSSCFFNLLRVELDIRWPISPGKSLVEAAGGMWA